MIEIIPEQKTKPEMNEEIVIILHPLSYEKGVIIPGYSKVRISADKLSLLKDNLKKENFTISTNTMNDLLISHPFFSERSGNPISNKLEMRLVNIISKVLGNEFRLTFTDNRKAIKYPKATE